MLRLGLRYTGTSPCFQWRRSFIGHVMPGVIRPIHILWNQVIGFVFIVLATVFGSPVDARQRTIGLQASVGQSLSPDGLVWHFLLLEGAQNL